MKQLDIFEEIDHTEDKLEMIEIHYLNTKGEPLPWEEEDHSLNCKKIPKTLDKLTRLVYYG